MKPMWKGSGTPPPVDGAANEAVVEVLAEATGAIVIRQHVPEDFASLPKFPKALE